MLIRFRVENFLSFEKQVELSLIPGSVRSHENHIARGTGKTEIDVLRAALIYGANAAGKSNLVRAIDFAKVFILEGTRPNQHINVSPFRLSFLNGIQPSKFEFDIKVSDNSSYSYGFSLDEQCVHEEWLYEIKKTTQTLLFERKTPPGEETKVVFSKKLTRSKKQRDFLEFVGIGTRPNQLFLTECAERNVKQFEEVYNWFREKLTVIFPNSHAVGVPGITEFGSIKVAEGTLVNLLHRFDTGICGMGYQDISSEELFPTEVLDDIKKDLKKGEKVAILSPDNIRYVVEYNDEEPSKLKIKRMDLKHKGKNGEEFFLDQESDGTTRLLDFIPMLEEKENNDYKVYIVDELERSLHPIITYELIQNFLALQGNNQLIATTHESSLLNFELLRRDEIWFVEKDVEGASHLYSLEEFTPRYDRDIEKGYLMGRFGGIPVVGKIELEKEK